MTDILFVLLCGTITALATGLGAIPFAVVKEVTPAGTGRLNAVAGGLMLGASFGLLVEGRAESSGATLAGAGVGVVFVLVSERLLSRYEIDVGDLRGASARRAVLLLLVMTVHSFAEGVAVGVSFGGGERLAAFITLAIAVHNIPEGVAVSAAMRGRGAGLVACALASIATSLPQPVMAVPAFLFVESFRATLPYGLGFAAGAMTFVVFLELLPEAYEKAPAEQVGLLLSASLAAMILFQWLL